RRRHTRSKRDWSSDVCSSDLTTTLDITLRTVHSVAISGLAESTTYHYRVKSKDAAGNLATSGDAIFVTADITPPLISGVAVSSLDRKSTRLNSSHVSISYAVF